MKVPLPAGPCGSVIMRVPSVTGSVPIVRAVVEKIAQAGGATEGETTAVSLAIDEAIANVIEHAYFGAPDKVIDVCFDLTPPQKGAVLVVTIRHYGVQVDPAAIKGRELSDVRPGGLGVHIISSVMDEVEYVCLPEGGMKATLMKRLSSGKG